MTEPRRRDCPVDAGRAQPRRDEYVHRAHKTFHHHRPYRRPDSSSRSSWRTRTNPAADPRAITLFCRVEAGAPRFHPRRASAQTRQQTRPIPRSCSFSNACRGARLANRIDRRRGSPCFPPRLGTSMAAGASDPGGQRPVAHGREAVRLTLSNTRCARSSAGGERTRTGEKRKPPHY